MSALLAAFLSLPALSLGVLAPALPLAAAAPLFSDEEAPPLSPPGRTFFGPPSLPPAPPPESGSTSDANWQMVISR